MGRTNLVAAVAGGFFLLAPVAVEAASAYSLVAGPNWLGIDGRWSTFDLQVGSKDPQTVSLTVSTALSEVWIVQNTGCGTSSLCTAARGGVYDIHASSSWNSLGPWQLGPGDIGMGGNGDYGLETLAIGNHVTNKNLTINSALVAGINDTYYFNGFIGIGATPGVFANSTFNKTSIPLINQLVEKEGVLPSHSYGYTAGASYVGNQAGVSGTPASLTLGGYDANRFTPHDVAFNIDPNGKMIPRVLLRGIIAHVPSADKAPTAWGAASRVLSSMNESTVAIIDSSTPYLWLPEAVCDSFAEALGLTFNATYGLYMFKSNQQYLDFLKRDLLSFTFAMSSFDNTNDFGEPFNAQGVVNITISSAAFALTVQYPFPPMAFKDPAIPYFPLMRAPKNHSIIIGRSFMQEAYMITRYEEGTFSVHQALFPQDARTNTKIVDIQHTDNNVFPIYNPPAGGGLPTAIIVGIVFAALLGSSLLALAFWLMRRRKQRALRQQQALERGDDDLKKDNSSSLVSEPPVSPIERIFSFIIRRKRSRKPVMTEVDGSSKHPVEADAQHQLYEMPVPIEPVELDSTGRGSFGDDTTEFGTEGSQGLSPYEIARIKLARQLQGPVPSYSPPADGALVAGDDKTEQDVSPVAHYRPADDASPVSSPTDDNTGSLPDTFPSPMTPHGDWTNRFDGLPSPMTVAPPLPLLFTKSVSSEASTADPGVSPNTYNPSSMSRSSSSNGSTQPAHSPSSLVPPSAVYQRTPIDPSRVVCLGPLPENVQAPQPPAPPLPRIIVPTADRASAAAVGEQEDGDSRPESTDTLGSNFTVDEAAAEVSHGNSARDAPRSPNSAERIDATVELVHVPQLAERRYSWEDERS